MAIFKVFSIDSTGAFLF
uniref:Uncharacterized protein n=1 Tax=Anguilla anguilla TaxID=7936 RepID=A0A0E9TCP0_ANGAN